MEGGELEVVVGLGDGFGEPAAVWAEDAGRAVDVGFVGDAVLAGVGAFIDEAILLELGEEVLDAVFVVGVGGADVADFFARDGGEGGGWRRGGGAGVGDTHAVPEVAEGGGDLVGELLRRDAGGDGGALDLLAVLVGAGEEEDVVSE